VTEARGVLEAARALGLEDGEVEPWGRGVAKVDARAVLARAQGRPRGRLVLVTAITPTEHGEGKTTVLVGLVQALHQLGARALGAVRQPTLGPVFGLKGGGNGGGASQVVPRDRFDLHLTGDAHAVQVAHNLAASLIDADLHRPGAPDAVGLDPATVTWPRVIDLCDRALRSTVLGLGHGNGPPREVPWHITAASEVMAILALARDLPDLRARLGRAVVGATTRARAGAEVTLEELRAAGPMAALLVDAARPNLLLTTEGAPVLAHAGPFANVAHGCSSVVADRLGLAVADWVVTEAGFGADLGAEKFFDIVCRQAGLGCAAAVVVATARALEAHGRAALARERGAAPAPSAEEARARGAADLARQVALVRRFGPPVVVAVNAFQGDAPAALEQVARAGLAAGAYAAVVCRPFDEGGAGCLELARAVLEAGAPARGDEAEGGPPPALLYDDDLPLAEGRGDRDRRVRRAGRRPRPDRRAGPRAARAGRARDAPDLRREDAPLADARPGRRRPAGRALPVARRGGAPARRRGLRHRGRRDALAPPRPPAPPARPRDRPAVRRGGAGRGRRRLTGGQRVAIGEDASPPRPLSLQATAPPRADEPSPRNIDATPRNATALRAFAAFSERGARPCPSCELMDGPCSPPTWPW
jgi:formate--tetrahydrofolate ligase